MGKNSAAIKIAEATKPLSETLGSSLLFTDHQSELEKQLSSIEKIARESMENPHEKTIKEFGKCYRWMQILKLQVRGGERIE